MRLAVSVALLVLFVGFVALGVWQVQRLAWKTALIAQVDALSVSYTHLTLPTIYSV